MWVGFTQWFEGFKKKTDDPEEEEIVLTDGLQTPTATSALPWGSSLLAYSADFEHASFH
jgi:hypothetical protein